jgi:membrane protein required for colicin V production
MNIADYLVIALVVTCAIVGLMRGFLREIIAVASWLIALIAAGLFGPRLVPHLGGALASAQVGPWAARLIVVGAVLLLGAAVAATVAYFVRLSLFSGMDRLLGFALGLARGLLILGVAVLFCQMLHLNGERWWHKSILLPYGERVSAPLRSLVGGGGESRSAQRGGQYPLSS